MNKQLEDIKAIREIMEKSTKSLSFSGFSGVLVGITAIFGAAFAYFYLLRDPSLTDYNRMQEIRILFADAIIVLLLSIFFVVFFSGRKARKNGQKIFNKVTVRTIYSLGIPLLTGGVFCLVMLMRGNIEVVVSATLIFYGLALINASKYTFDEIQYLGITEVVLGLLAIIFTHNGIIFWTLGFGVCHIVYGLIMHVKYDRKKQ